MNELQRYLMFLIVATDLVRKNNKPQITLIRIDFREIILMLIGCDSRKFELIRNFSQKGNFQIPEICPNLASYKNLRK